ncbi:MAG: bifunctional DNA-formamidopyrimidine glycosylase/DNA-(apurinic or apyrimidinic site) lyase [Burkholderiaceae bacterium]
MPELPEVEVTRRALTPRVVAGVVREVCVREHRLRHPVPDGLDALLRGRELLGIGRRGKYLLWRFAHGTLISHLGMSGVWRVHDAPAPPPRRHDHVDLVFDEVVGRLTDPRRFGALLWHSAAAGEVENHPLLAGLGLEPFDPRFSGAWLYAGIRGRSAAIKQVLLAGDVVVGVGNIYCSESLFRAGINPKLSARRLGPVRCERLAQAVREVLTQAIEAGGSTLKDFVSAEGAAGYFMLDAGVYGREGETCRVCGTVIRRIMQGQRATYYCPHCQRH